MNWPAHSPDLSPTENLCGILAHKVYRRVCVCGGGGEGEVSTPFNLKIEKVDTACMGFQ